MFSCFCCSEALPRFLFGVLLEKMNSFMKVAKDLAEESLRTNAGGPFGACIVKDGKMFLMLL